MGSSPARSGQRVVKLGRQQLRALVREAFAPGIRVVESPIREEDGVEHDLLVAMEVALDAAVDDYLSTLYDPDDPSMVAAGGAAAWRTQVNAACAELVRTVMESSREAAKSVVDRLVNGDYYRGPGA